MTSTPATVRRLPAILPTARQAGIVTVFTLLLSWLLHLFSGTAYPAVFGRIGFLGAALLLAYSAAGALRPRWLSLPAARLGAVVLTAPLAALVLLLATQPSRYATPMAKTADIIGHVIMVVLAILFGVLFSLLAMRSERRERERADRLQTELTQNTLERQLLDARLRLLQAQIEPHFLFNSLANVAALIEAEPTLAGRLLDALIRYLRSSLARTRAEGGTLGDEVDLLTAYLDVLKIRMGERLRYVFEIAPELVAAPLPPMLLQPLVENAIRHGLEPKVAGGSLRIAARREGARLLLSVTDDGLGFAGAPGDGVGLSNIRARLAALFGPAARLDLRSGVGAGVTATLEIPA